MAQAILGDALHDGAEQVLARQFVEAEVDARKRLFAAHQKADIPVLEPQRQVSRSMQVASTKNSPGRLVASRLLGDAMRWLWEFGMDPAFRGSARVVLCGDRGLPVSIPPRDSRMARR